MTLQGRWFTATLLPQPLTESEARRLLPFGAVYLPLPLAEEIDRANERVAAGEDPNEVVYGRATAG